MGADEEALFLGLFSFSLTRKAKTCLQSPPNQTLTGWKDVETKFLACFLSPLKNIEAKVVIATFIQGVNEPLCEAWERSKTFFRKSPTHGFEVEMQVQTFCSGLQS